MYKCGKLGHEGRSNGVTDKTQSHSSVGPIVQRALKRCSELFSPGFGRLEDMSVLMGSAKCKWKRSWVVKKIRGKWLSDERDDVTSPRSSPPTVYGAGQLGKLLCKSSCTATLELELDRCTYVPSFWEH
eukprot:scaffold291597_cov44-Tisochrysis_lutea.AAC.1